MSGRVPPDVRESLNDAADQVDNDSGASDDGSGSGGDGSDNTTTRRDSGSGLDGGSGGGSSSDSDVRRDSGSGLDGGSSGDTGGGSSSDDSPEFAGPGRNPDDPDAGTNPREDSGTDDTVDAPTPEEDTSPNRPGADAGTNTAGGTGRNPNDPINDPAGGTGVRPEDPRAGDNPRDDDTPDFAGTGRNPSAAGVESGVGEIPDDVRPDNMVEGQGLESRSDGDEDLQEAAQDLEERAIEESDMFDDPDDVAIERRDDNTLVAVPTEQGLAGAIEDQAEDVEQQVIEDDPRLEGQEDVAIQLNEEGNFEAEATELAEFQFEIEQQAEARAQIEEETGYDLPGGSVERVGRSYVVNERGQDAVERQIAEDIDEQTTADIEPSDIERQGDEYRLTEGARTDLAAARAEVESGRDVVDSGTGRNPSQVTSDEGLRNVGEEFESDDFEITEDGEVQLTDQYFEERMRDELGIAAEAGQDFEIDRSGEETSVELTSEGREEAITADALREGEVEVEGDTATVPAEAVSTANVAGAHLGVSVGGEEGEVTIGDNTRSIEIESADQLEFDEEGNLVDVSQPAEATVEENVDQLEAMGFTNAEAQLLANLDNAADISTDAIADVGQTIYDGGEVPGTDVEIGLRQGAALYGDIVASGAPLGPAGVAGSYVATGRTPQESAERILEGEQAESEEGETVIESTSTDFARGAGQIVPMAAETPRLVVSDAPELAAGATTFTAEAIDDEGVLEGSLQAGGAAADVGVDVAEDVAVQTINNPIQTGGTLAGSALVMGGAAAVSSRAGLATRAAIQPGEELLGYGGYGLTRRVASTRAADTLFPRQEPLIFSEEAAIMAASRAGSGLRRGAAGAADRLSAGADIPRAASSRVPSVEVEAGTEVTDGRIDLNVNSDLTSSLISTERGASAAATRVVESGRSVRDLVDGADAGGDFTPADIAAPVAAGARGARSAVGRGARGARDVAERVAEAPFEAFAFGRTGVRNIAVEAEAAEARGVEGAVELGEDIRRARRDAELNPSTRELLAARLQGGVSVEGDQSLLADVEGGEFDPTVLSDPLVAAGQRARGAGARVAELPGRAIDRARIGARNLAVEAEAAEAAGVEGAVELGEDMRRADRDAELNPSTRELLAARLQGGVSVEGDQSLLTDVEGGDITPADVVAPAAGAAGRVADAARTLRDAGIRVDVGKPGRSVRTGDLEVDDDVGTPAEIVAMDAEAGEGFGPDIDPDQLPADLEFESEQDADPSTAPVEVEAEGESGVAVQRTVREVETETEREADQGDIPLRVQFDDAGETAAQASTPSVETGVDTGIEEGLDSAVENAAEVLSETEQRREPGRVETPAEFEAEVEAETEVESERSEVGLEFEFENEMEQELEFETETEVEAEVEPWVDPNTSLEGDDPSFEDIGADEVFETGIAEAEELVDEFGHGFDDAAFEASEIEEEFGFDIDEDADSGFF